MNKVISIAMAAALCLFSSCEKEDSDVVINVYTGEQKNGNVEELADGSVKVQLDMSGDYEHWYYYSFDEQMITRLGINDAEPIVWDLAFHRFDVKTNGCGVIEYGADAYSGINEIPAEGYVLDTENDSIAVDMTDMMNGNIGYVNTSINSALSRFVTYSLEEYPPIYTYHPKCWVVRTKGAKFYKMKVSDWRNKSLTANVVLEYKRLNN